MSDTTTPEAKPEREIVTRQCPEPGCEEMFTGPKNGRANIGMRIGAHRAQKHGYKSPKVKKKTSRPAPGPTTPIALSVVRDAAEEISERSSKPPTIEELSRAGARLIGTLSVAVASWAAETDPTITTEADRDALVDFLSAEPSAAKDMAYPFARAFGRSKMNARMGRTIVDNVDMASAAAEIAQLAWRWRRYLRERDRRIAQMAPTPGAAPAVTSPGVGPAPMPPPAPPGSPPPTSGVVVTPEMVASMTGRNGAA